MTEYSLAEGAARMARIAAEAQCADSGVKAPDRAWAGSAVSNLVALKPGDTYISNREVAALSDDFSERTAEINRAKHLLRKSMSAAIARANGIIHDGSKFITESAVVATESGRLYACVFVTRSAQGAAQDEDDEL